MYSPLTWENYYSYLHSGYLQYNLIFLGDIVHISVYCNIYVFNRSPYFPFPHCCKTCCVIYNVSFLNFMKEEKFMKQEIYERAAEGNKYNTFAM